MWHDLCAVSREGGSIKPSAGCVQDGLHYHANGILDNGELPIGGVKVRLGAGECPSSGLRETTTITTDLSYSCTGLNAGTYCVLIDPLQEGNGWNLLPGTRFTKTWRVRNGGNCTWGPGLTVHALSFVYGAQLDAPAEMPLTQNVPPGSTFDVSIEMIAPNVPGVYRSEWMFHIADGPLLGVGADRQTPLAAQIIVGMQDTPPEIWQTYTSTTGLFSIRYPATNASYENEIPSVDGVLAPGIQTGACCARARWRPAKD